MDIAVIPEEAHEGVCCFVTGFALEFSHTGTVVCVCIAYHIPGVEWRKHAEYHCQPDTILRLQPKSQEHVPVPGMYNITLNRSNTTFVCLRMIYQLEFCDRSILNLKVGHPTIN